MRTSTICTCCVFFLIFLFSRKQNRQERGINALNYYILWIFKVRSVMFWYEMKVLGIGHWTIIQFIMLWTPNRGKIYKFKWAIHFSFYFWYRLIFLNILKVSREWERERNLHWPHNRFEYSLFFSRQHLFAGNNGKKTSISTI